jgi:hypothetical protein
MDLISEAIATYLTPLLKKHESGEALTRDNLEAAYAKAKTVTGSKDKRLSLEKLRGSQVTAYQEAAAKGIQDWERSITLEPIHEDDTESSLKKIERCEGVRSSQASQLTNWKMTLWVKL